MTNKSTACGGMRRAFLVGLAGAGIALLILSGAVANAATAPSGKPALPVGAASTDPAHPANAAPVAHAPVSRGNDRETGSCANALVILRGFTTSATTVPTGTNITLTASLTCDIGPTVYWAQIFDTRTGALVANCYTGTSCTATVSQSAASTHNYVAYLDEGGSSYPPARVAATSINAYVTWQATPDNLSSFSISLSGPSTVGHNAGPGTYTAYVNQDVGPTMYYIEIFDETTNTRLWECRPGASCTVSFTPSETGDNLVAFVSGYSTALPPAWTQASSNILETRQEPPLP